MTDPLEVFPELICEKIFSSLSFNDLLNCSLINKSYYEFIANSHGCMDKIKIFINSTKLTTEHAENLDILKKSTRKYVHIEAFSMSIDGFNAHLLKFKFKSIKLKRFMVYDGDELEKFFTQICGHIEHLRLVRFVNTHIANFEPTFSLSFPKIKHLELNYVPHFVYQILSTTSSLKELNITGKRDILFNIILKQNRLKRLSIVTSEIDSYFDDNLAVHTFQLEYFEARDIYNLSASCIQNFKLFLESQMKSLVEIDLGDWIAADIVKMIFHMPKLKTLTFKGFHNVEEHINMLDMEFHKSLSITTLNLIDTFSRLDIIQAFVLACPHVVHMKMYSLKDNALGFLAQTIPGLRTLSVDLMEVTDLKNEYDFMNMTEFSMKVCHKNLKISHATDNNFENLVRKEIMNLEEKNKVKFIIS